MNNLHGQREIRDLIEEYSADRALILRSEPFKFDVNQIESLVKLNAVTFQALRPIDFEDLDAVGKVDFVLFSRHLVRELRRLDLEREHLYDLLRWAPFAVYVFDVEIYRTCFEPMNASRDAQRLHDIRTQVVTTLETLRQSVEDIDWTGLIDLIECLTTVLDEWAGFYRGYDPQFDWWVEKPLLALKDALGDFSRFLQEKVDAKGIGYIPGRPVGREVLEEALGHEMIPYSPEELIEIGEREYGWCEERLKLASREMGFGDDWLKALSHVKDQYVEPGRQPEIVSKLAEEAVSYVRHHDLVTVPDLAEHSWRMAMMSPEDQKVNPFFLGGEQIIVSYPTNEMSHEEKLMSMRGNAPALSRATVQHELIPGHHLQMYMTKRYRPYRRVFSTPFWIEGWTINWEMVLWDLGFPRTPEERIGMLFWRIHRAARIVFSIKFHLGQMTAQECVDILVERVGHERANAEGEVRRSFGGKYPPLYQAAYMIGGIMFRAMRHELVDSGQMTIKEFHDAVLRENDIPPVILRSILRGDEFTADFEPVWRFDEV